MKTRTTTMDLQQQLNQLDRDMPDMFEIDIEGFKVTGIKQWYAGVRRYRLSARPCAELIFTNDNTPSAAGIKMRRLLVGVRNFSRPAQGVV